MRLHDGDNLPNVLESFAVDKKLSSALCFFVGGVKEKGRIVVGPSDGNSSTINPMVRLLSGVHEGCGIGTIFVDEKGKPKLHMHASFGRGNDVITGCIRMGIDIWKIGEIIILEVTGTTAYRKKDQTAGLEFLEIK